MFVDGIWSNDYSPQPSHKCRDWMVLILPIWNQMKFAILLKITFIFLLWTRFNSNWNVNEYTRQQRTQRQQKCKFARKKPGQNVYKYNTDQQLNRQLNETSALYLHANITYKLHPSSPNGKINNKTYKRSKLPVWQTLYASVDGSKTGRNERI